MSSRQVTTPIDAAFAVLQRSIDALWSNLANKSESNSPERLLFTSSVHSEGTTTVTSCSAIGLARHLRESVLIVEANTYKPGLASYFGLPDGPGFADVIQDESMLDEAILTTSVPGLAVLPAGASRIPTPGEFATESTAEILKRAERGYRYVLIDGPPILLYPESRVLLRYVDEAVLVVQAGLTKKQVAENALQILKSSGVWVAGVVLNRFEPELPKWMGRNGVPT
jgi:receptor protein-tyrosine kinase/non-specific protein-tyrosine kinase